MHGGWEGEGQERKRRRHMWPVPPVLGTNTTVDASDSTSTATCITSDSFCKDGRKISVGDCALFKPFQDTSRPFIGIIRSLTQDKKKYLQLGVNWLYRRSEVILGKGVFPDAAPNEVFYSFHKDEIPAASLLHPCKVAFLGKGVELPSGICSYVCRRVYDISNKRLWWLTDQDYINKRQEEVNKLLNKSRLEMHAAVQSEGRSPKSSNGPTSAQQLKSGSDGAQNSATSFSPPIKVRKRDRGDQGSETIKRERSMKIEDVNSCQLQLESALKLEITKITDKGGLVDLEGVEKLVQLMQPERAEKKLDIAGRMMLTDVITATEKYDLLVKFVHLKGLSVLDGWLQEVQKGKICDGNISKESDGSVEEFLFALLRALDKLPVDLHALQTCNIGKSVNHLRGHKNLEIQKKARGLVDTWKKRVEAEMNMNDARSRPNQAVSWSNRSGIAEGTHGGNRRVGGSSEVHIKSSNSQTSVSKAAPVKPGHGDSSKLTSSVGSVKISASLPTPAVASRDPSCKIPVGYSASDVQLSTIKEEKSSSSSQSQNNSQTCTSDHAKPSSLWREDARSSTAGSFNASKTSNNASRHRKSSNANAVSTAVGGQKESTIVKCSSVERKTTSEKIAQVGLTGDRTVDAPPADNGNSHRLIVRLPNLTRSPARSTNGGALDDTSVMVSRVSSPKLSEKQDQLDRKVKLKSNSLRTSTTGVNRELRHRNAVNDEQTGSDEGDESPTTLHDEEHDRISNEGGKAFETSKVTHSSGIHKGCTDPDLGMSHEASLRSINVLIESCVTCSEAAPLMSAGDDRGMNLLASVAAGEMTKSEQVSPIDSPGRSSSAPEDFSAVNCKNRSCPEDVAVHGHCQRNNSADGVFGEQVPGVGEQVKEEEQQDNGGEHITSSGARNLFEEDCRTSSVAEEKPTGEHNEQLLVSGKNLQQCDDQGFKSDNKPDVATSSSVPSTEKREGVVDGEVGKMETNVSCGDNDSQKIKPLGERLVNRKDDCADEKTGNSVVNNSTSGVVCRSVADACDIKNESTGVKVEKEPVKASPTRNPLEPICLHEVSADSMPKVSNLNRKVEETAEVAEHFSASVIVADPINGNEKIDCAETRTHVKQNDSQQMSLTNTASASIDEKVAVDVGSVASDQNNGVDNFEQTDNTAGLSVTEDPLDISHEEGKKCVKSSKTEGDRSKECVSNSGVPVATEIRSNVSWDFDLNEGFPVDEVGQGEPNISFAPECSSVVNMHGHLPSLPSLPSGPGMPLVPVAAAAKGPFVPPENLTKKSGEIGWRGSAATSAFRPAEPRKVLEMPLTTTDIPPDTAFNKQGRPPLDIDLNEPDERLHEDMCSQLSAQAGVSSAPAVRDYRRNEGVSSASIRSAGGLDLDLNKADDDTETGHLSSSIGRRFDVLSARQSSSVGFSNGEVNVLRNFDLNNGPGFDEAGFEQLPARQHAKNGLPFMPSVAGLRMSTVDFGNLSSWYPPGNSYPAVAIPSILPDRGEQIYPVASTSGAQRILGQPTPGIAFGPDGYRGQVLSSSPAVAFPQGAAFPYPGFPFGTNFPLPSTSFSSGSAMYLESSSTGGLCFSAIPSQLVGASSAVSSNYPRPYMINHPDGGTTASVESNRRWGRHGLDLNAGPGGTEIEGREERLASASRQLSTASSQTLAEEQMRMYQAAGVALKRKEPEGGWDVDRFSYKQQHSWQ